MSAKYTKIVAIDKNNQWQNIDAVEETALLNLLNSQKYQTRQVAQDPQIIQTITYIESEIIQEVEDNINKGIISEADQLMYQDNCHTWTRIFNDKLKWPIVWGYLVQVKSLQSNNDFVYLNHHSVVRHPQQNWLLELTYHAGSDLNANHFIEHISGKNYLKLMASK